MRTLVTMLIVAAAVVGLCSVAPAAAARGVPPNVGGWSPIKDVKNPHIQQLGRWAVTQHVKEANDGLGFGKVVSGEEQVVAGMNYKLVLEATNSDGNSATYGAEVYEEEWTKKRELLSFKPAN